MHRALAVVLALTFAASAHGQVTLHDDGISFPDSSKLTTANIGSYAQGVMVAKSGGDFTTITAALDSITDATSSKRYLVRIAPGTYAERVEMKTYVDLAGSGPGVTVISAAGSSSAGATVTNTVGSNLRDLSIVNTGGANYAIALRVTGQPLLENLEISVSSSIFSCRGIDGSWGGGFHGTMRHVTVSASCNATFSFAVSLTPPDGGSEWEARLEDVSIQASGSDGVGRFGLLVESGGSTGFLRVSARGLRVGVLGGGPAVAVHLRNGTVGELFDVELLAGSASNDAHGISLYNTVGSRVHGGTITAEGGAGGFGTGVVLDSATGELRNVVMDASAYVVRFESQIGNPSTLYAYGSQLDSSFDQFPDPSVVGSELVLHGCRVRQPAPVGFNATTTCFATSDWSFQNPNGFDACP